MKHILKVNDIVKVVGFSEKEMDDTPLLEIYSDQIAKIVRVGPETDKYPIEVKLLDSTGHEGVLLKEDEIEFRYDREKHPEYYL